MTEFPFSAVVAMDEVNWRAPIYSEDVLHLDREVLARIASRSQPDRGVIKSSYALSNQAGDVVLTLVSSMLMQRRPADAPREVDHGLEVDAASRCLANLLASHGVKEIGRLSTAGDPLAAHEVAEEARFRSAHPDRTERC